MVESVIDIMEHNKNGRYVTLTYTPPPRKRRKLPLFPENTGEENVEKK